MTDLHLLQPDMRWDERPEDHTERSLRELKAHLRPGDTLINLGDMVWSRAPRQQAQQLLGRVAQEILAGVHHLLVLGNHDKLPRRDYADAGILVLEQLVIQNTLFSHLGSQTLPDGVSAQVLGHYHQMPAHPQLPNALQLSHSREQLRPVALEKLMRRIDTLRLRRELPERLDDRWHLERSVPEQD